MTSKERRWTMYVDKDSMGLISIMEINPSETYIMTEALIRYASNPDISVDKRDKAKFIAIQIDIQQESKS